MNRALHKIMGYYHSPLYQTVTRTGGALSGTICGGYIYADVVVPMLQEDRQWHLFTSFLLHMSCSYTTVGVFAWAGYILGPSTFPIWVISPVLYRLSKFPAETRVRLQ